MVGFRHLAAGAAGGGEAAGTVKYSVFGGKTDVPMERMARGRKAAGPEK